MTTKKYDFQFVSLISQRRALLKNNREVTHPRYSGW